MRRSRVPAAVFVRLATVVCIATVVVLTASVQSQVPSYTVYTTDGRRSLPFRAVSGADYVALESLASMFGLTIAEDNVAGGLSVRGRSQTILLIPGQSFASLGQGRVVSMPAAVQRNGQSWQVPVEFIRVALGPALGLRVDIRKATRLILVGDVRVPQISGRFERQPSGARLVVDIQPATPHRVTREGQRLLVRFEAAALDFAPIGGLVPEFATAIRADGSNLVIDLGSSAANFRAADLDETHLLIELTPAAAPPPPPAPALPSVTAPRAPQALEAPPILDTTPAGSLRTVILDPGHGGEDAGVRGPGGTVEKDYVLQLARRIKAAIESRIGLRVLLTRDNDDDVPFDRRIAVANNNKADLFITLHANASPHASTRGAQVLSLDTSSYQKQPAAAQTRELPVPVYGGGSRTIDIVAWNLAQLPFASRSTAVAEALAQQLSAHNVPMNARPVTRMPVRTLVGANMPAVMLEVGFLSNADDETALNGPAVPAGITDAILDTVAELRRSVLPSGVGPRP